MIVLWYINSVEERVFCFLVRKSLDGIVCVSFWIKVRRLSFFGYEVVGFCGC